MVFQMLAFKKDPKAELVPNSEFINPDSPVVDEPDVDEKMPRPRLSRMPPSPDPDAAGVASPRRAVGTEEISCDSVLCAVPADVAAAWVAAADWAVSALALVICCGAANGVRSVATAEEPA